VVVPETGSLNEAIEGLGELDHASAIGAHILPIGGVNIDKILRHDGIQDHMLVVMLGHRGLYERAGDIDNDDDAILLRGKDGNVQVTRITGTLALQTKKIEFNSSNINLYYLFQREKTLTIE
jgi:hypothetical protein